MPRGIPISAELMDWTAEKVAELLALRSQGFSIATIARRWGTTKGTVLGKWQRLQRVSASKEELPRSAPRAFCYQLALPAPPALLALPPPKRGRGRPPKPKPIVHSGPWQVFEVKPAQRSCVFIGGFEKRRAAQICASEAYDFDGAFRLIYLNGQFRGGVCWKPANNELWKEAEALASVARCDIT